MAVNDIFLVTVVGDLHGQTTNYVLHYRETLSGAGYAPARLATAWELALAAPFRAWASDEWAYKYVQVQRIFPLPVTAYVQSNGAAGPGAVDANALPSECAIVITKVSEFAGRDRRGRVFLAGVPDTYEVDSAVSPGGLVATLGLANQLDNVIVDPVNAWEWEPVIQSRIGGVAGVAVRWVSSRVNPAIRSQRRRQIGKGV